jgi:membrane-associated protease RseP (regulator of RpoE activity)
MPFLPLVFILLLDISCQATTTATRGTAELPTTQTASPLAATRPAPTELQPVRRLTLLRSILLGSQQEYLTAEGPSRRGKLFEKLISGLDQVRRKEPPMTEIEVLAWLGPPDYGDSDERGAQYDYVFHAGSDDSYASLIFDANGLLDRVGWNTATQLHSEELRPFKVVHLADFAVKKHEVLGAGYLGLQVDGVYWEQDGHMYIGSYGVKVTSVAGDSPASRAGIQVGDRIIRINGARFENREFVEHVSQLQPGQVISLMIERKPIGTAKAEKEKIDVTVGSRPPSQ